VGDSAGGNLVAALTVMAIERKYRIPDGILLSYPALCLSKQDFRPSLLLAMDDPILPHPFLKMCIESYVGNIHPQCDASVSQFISPILASDLTLSKFPKTRIMVAANDPLRDESFMFTYKLAKLDVDVHLKEYLHMPHGFLNYNSPMMGMKDECNETIK